MKIKSLFPLVLMLVFACTLMAQESSTSRKIIYKYTFEGMKDSTEIIKMKIAVLELKNVTSCDVIFKSAAHKYAQLKVEVQIPEKFDENTPDITGPSTFKNLLERLGYMPGECKTNTEN